MSKQNIQNISINDLHLWTENPRDPVDPKSNDADIIKRAIEKSPKVWNLDKLFKEMGDYYDFSELPTVVFMDEVPVVFDGNRRIAVVKCVQNPSLLANVTGKLFFNGAPKELCQIKNIPCNVCDKETALNNIERKHTSNGSWGIIQREYFLHQHRNRPKSLFLILQEQLNLITDYPILNQRYVKDEILTASKLKDIGFVLEGGKLVSNYDQDQQQELFSKIASLISAGHLTTRTNRGSLKQTLIEKFPELQGTVFPFDKTKPSVPVSPGKGTTPVVNPTAPVLPGLEGVSSPRKTPKTSPSDEIFGRTLFLEKGPVNDLYTAICDIYERFSDKENVLPVIGMSLRLILDVAGRIHFERIGQAAQANDDGVSGRFIKEAKKELKDSWPINTKNAAALTLDWISDNNNLAAIVHKFAHGSIDNSKRTIVQTSVIVGDILEHYFKRK